MGHPENITLETIAKSAMIMEENGEETLKHIKELIGKTTPQEIEQKIQELKDSQAGVP